MADGSSSSHVEDLTATALVSPQGPGVGDLAAAALAAVNALALALTPAEADAANEQAVRAVVPLLRAGATDSSRVQVVREGLKELHAAAVKGELPEAGLQQRIQEALRCLAEVGPASAAGDRQATIAEAGKRKVSAGSSCNSNTTKRQRSCIEDGSGDEQPLMTIDDLPCRICGDSQGSDMLVCDWCAASAGHLGCLGFSEVPTDVWLCSSKCEAHREAAVAAGKLHGRWVLGTFQGIEEPFWGQLCYVAYGVLKIRYGDGEVYRGVRVSHLVGQEMLADHQGLLLQPEACTVPVGVLKLFQAKGWLV